MVDDDIKMNEYLSKLLNNLKKLTIWPYGY